MSGDNYWPGGRGGHNTGYDSYQHGADNYRPHDPPSHSYYAHEYPPPPPPYTDNRNFSFKGAARAGDQRPYQFYGHGPPGASHGFQPLNSPPGPSYNFDFRPQHAPNAPSFPAEGPQGHHAGQSKRQKRQGKQPYQRKVWKGPPGASDRAILRAHRAPTPEQMHGMNQGESRFKALEDLTESNDADTDASMDTSDSEDETDGNVRVKDAGVKDATGESDDDEHPRAKRARVSSPKHENTGGSVRPQWSNPDPYTALPPPSESHPRGKDVLSLIRKAKVDGKNNAEKASASDFISLNFDDDQQNEKDEKRSSPSVQEIAPPFSHLNNLHPDRKVSDPLPPPPLASLSQPSTGMDVWPPPPVENGNNDGFGRAVQRQENAALATQPAQKAGKKRKHESSTDYYDLNDLWRPTDPVSSAPWHTDGHHVDEGTNADLW